MRVKRPELHVVTTGRQPAERVVPVLAEISPLVDRIHLREKALSAGEVYRMAASLAERGVPPEKIIINDRVDVAVAIGAGGVQLAWHSLRMSVVRRAFPGLRAGRSVHSEKEADEAVRDGADWLIYGHVFPTRSKPGLSPRGLEELGSIIRRQPVPVIAIGGILPENAGLPLEAGAAGIAVMSGILERPDPAKAAWEYAAILNRWVKKHGTNL
ncbi:thiamine phosphate synthase [Staphylospora marina]|uniref:thiamine phosphate synthase n=1 Tax=Staphylospora marina TaxID=2490858 RepID=UPI003B967F71